MKLDTASYTAVRPCLKFKITESLQIFRAFRAFFRLLSPFFYLVKVLVQNDDIRNISEINADIFKRKLDRDFFTPFRPHLKFKLHRKNMFRLTFQNIWNFLNFLWKFQTFWKITLSICFSYVILNFKWGRTGVKKFLFSFLLKISAFISEILRIWFCTKTLNKKLSLKSEKRSKGSKNSRNFNSLLILDRVKQL